MRKIMSKIMAAVMVMTLVLVMKVPAMAADEGQTTEKATLTISSKQAGAEYSVYQVMSAKKISEDLYSYTVNSDFEGAFPIKTDSAEYVLNKNNEICMKDGDKETPITGDGLAYDKATYNRTSDTAQLAAALEKYAVDKNMTASAVIKFEEAGNQSVSLPIGYYVVKQTKVPKGGYVASKAVLVNLTEDKNVTAKDDEEKLDKTITGLNGDTSGNADANTAKIGDKINYKVTTYIPTYGADVDKDSLKFWLYDTFSDGITYNNDVRVYISDTEGGTDKELTTNDYTTEKSANPDATFEINLKPDVIFENQGKYVTLVYSGTLNENAVVNSSAGNPNKIELTYTNSPDNGEDSLEDEVKTYTFGLGIKKVDKATQEELDGAVFTLTKQGEADAIKLIKESEGVYRVAKEGEEGAVEDIIVNSASGINPVIKGLDEGTYILHEKKAPDNYSVVPDITVTITAKKDANSKLTGEAEVKVSGSKLQQDEDVANTEIRVTTEGKIDINIYVEDTKGISLPETGSKTAMYCLLGGAVLVVLGGLYLGLTGRKKNI